MLVKKYQININFDLFDVPRDKLLVSGLAWQMVRNNKANADIFFGGDLNKNKGLWYIRDRLVQDFASLNQVEMLLWDAWGLMLSKQSIENDKNQLSYLDKIANMTIHPEHHLKEIVDRYKSDSNLKVPEKITSFSPIYKKRIIQV